LKTNTYNKRANTRSVTFIAGLELHVVDTHVGAEPCWY